MYNFCKIRLTAPKQNEFAGMAQDTMVYVFQFLELPERADIAPTSKLFYATFKHDYLWKPLLQDHFKEHFKEDQARIDAAKQLQLVPETLSFFQLYSYLRKTMCYECNGKVTYGRGYDKRAFVIRCTKCLKNKDLQAKKYAIKAGLNESELDLLPCIETQNPHNSRYAPMKVYDMNLVRRLVNKNIEYGAAYQRLLATKQRIARKDVLLRELQAQSVTKFDMRDLLLQDYISGESKTKASVLVKRYKEIKA